MGFARMSATAAAATFALAVGGLPGTHPVKTCAAAGPFWPTMTLALQGADAWVACKEQSRVVRVSTRTGKQTASVPLAGQALAVASGLGSVWTLDSTGMLTRLDPTSARVVKRIGLPVSAAYNIWIGGGSVWVADDQGAQVVRVSPQTNRVVARPRVDDGPADMAFSRDTAWVINHRVRVLTRIDLQTNVSTRLAVLGGDAPERMVFAQGSLWITGRGTDLLQVDPATGKVKRTIEIGASGIDIAVAGDDLWVPTRSAAADARGFPTMAVLRHVSVTTGAVTSVARSTGRVDVHGIVALAGRVWLADNNAGVLYRYPR